MDIMRFVTVENVILVIALCFIVYGIYDRYKRAKANDGVVTTDEWFGIFFAGNAEMAKLLKMAREASDVKSVDDERKFVAAHLPDLIDSAPMLSETEKQIIKGFGMEKLATLIVKDKKVDEPKEKN